MRFTLATGFDRNTQDEVTTTFDLDVSLIRETLQKGFDKMDYAERTAWIFKNAETGKLLVDER
jgi:adenylylsulfate kinase-like enzyme